MYHYLASPYTHVSPDIMRKRYEAAEAATAILLIGDIAVYSPIVHCHTLAVTHDLPKDFNFWMRYNYRMLSPAKSLLVLKIDGWEASTGVRAEIEYAITHGKPVCYLDPKNVMKSLSPDYAY